MGAVFLFFTYTKIRKIKINTVRDKKIENYVIVGILISFITISMIVLLTYTSITILIFRILFTSR